MKTLYILFATAALALAAPPKTFTGVISDAMCGKDHAMMNVKPDSKCVTECVKMGSKYALISGDDVYELSGTVPEKSGKTPEKTAANTHRDGAAANRDSTVLLYSSPQHQTRPKANAT